MKNTIQLIITTTVISILFFHFDHDNSHDFKSGFALISHQSEFWLERRRRAPYPPWWVFADPLSMAHDTAAELLSGVISLFCDRCSVFGGMVGGGGGGR